MICCRPPAAVSQLPEVIVNSNLQHRGGADASASFAISPRPDAQEPRRSIQMKRATPQTRHLAKRLIALEQKGHPTSEPRPLAGFYVCEKLRPPLATLMGNAGYGALLSRALVLATAEVRWLGAVHVNRDGALEGLGELSMQLDPAEIAEGRVVLLAQLLGLLVAFIGDDLTMRLTREVWPKLSFDGLNFGRR